MISTIFFQKKKENESKIRSNFAEMTLHYRINILPTEDFYFGEDFIYLGHMFKEVFFKATHTPKILTFDLILKYFYQ